MKQISTLWCSSRLRCVLAAMALAVLQPLCAQDLRVLSTITDSQGNQYSLGAMAISSNHRYVAGQAQSYATGNTGVFVYDLQTDSFVVEEGANELGGDLRAVSDNGVATGFNPNAITLSIDGKRQELFTPDDSESGARDISDDGSTVVGCFWTYETFYPHACIWRDGQLVALPEPTTEEMGFEVYGTSASYCSSDASVIAGYVYDALVTFPLIVWRLQEDGSYVCDPVCSNYFGRYADDESKPYTLFRAGNVSRNGQYAAATVSQQYGETHMARLNLETGELEEFVSDGTGSVAAGIATEGVAVANDGTLAGWYMYGSARAACIWYPGAAEPEQMAMKYPGVTKFAEYDLMGYHLLYDITPDAEVGLGFAYNTDFMFESYVFDFKEAAMGIESAKDGGTRAAETARYATDGRRLNAPTKGINIVRHADGQVTKVVGK